MLHESATEHFMRIALRQAAAAAEAGEVPVGAVVAHKGRLVAQAHNQVETLKDPTAHAEMIAITQAAAAVGDWRLTDTVLYVTKEPCAMCAGAMVLARIPTLVFGVPDPERGGAVSVFNITDCPRLNHRVEVVRGVLEDECRALLQGFFRERRGARGRDAASRDASGGPRRSDGPPDTLESHKMRLTGETPTGATAHESADVLQPVPRRAPCRGARHHAEPRARRRGHEARDAVDAGDR